MTLNVVVDQFVVNLILPSHFHFTFSLIFLPGKCFHYFWSFMNLLKTCFRIYHHLWFFFLEHIVIFLDRLLETIILFSVNFLLFYLWPSFPFCMLGPWIQWQMLFLFLSVSCWQTPDQNTAEADTGGWVGLSVDLSPSALLLKVCRTVQYGQHQLRTC